MKREDRMEALAQVVVPEAIEWVGELKRYRAYQGKDLEYFRKARIGLGVVSNAVRLCATIENARTNDLVQARLSAGDEAGPKMLQAAKTLTP